MCFCETYYSYLLPGSHDTGRIYKVMVQRSIMDILENALFWQRHTDQWSAVEDHPVVPTLCSNDIILLSVFC